jgi:hypothetical protein
MTKPKINFIAIIAGILALASLALPWFVGGFNSSDVNMEFTAYLYQIAGVVNSVSQTVTVAVWFGLVAVAFLLIAAVSSFVGSFVVGKKGQLLILAAGILALMSMVVFGAGILNSNFVVEELNPRYTLSYFPNNFGLTADQIDNGWYDYSWSLSIGFWLALGSAIVAFVSLVTHNMQKVKSAATPNVNVN